MLPQWLAVVWVRVSGWVGVWEALVQFGPVQVLPRQFLTPLPTLEPQTHHEDPLLQPLVLTLTPTGLALPEPSGCSLKVLGLVSTPGCRGGRGFGPSSATFQP